MMGYLKAGVKGVRSVRLDDDDTLCDDGKSRLIGLDGKEIHRAERRICFRHTSTQTASGLRPVMSYESLMMASTYPAWSVAGQKSDPGFLRRELYRLERSRCAIRAPHREAEDFESYLSIITSILCRIARTGQP